MSLGEQGQRIDYAKLTQSIRYQLAKIVVNPEYQLSFLNVFVDDEQNFLKRTDYVDNAVYIVIHYGEATTDFASSVISVSLRVLGIENAVEPARELLNLFSSQYNMQYIRTINAEGIEEIDYNTLQSWRIPSVVSNFVETDNDFRNLLNVSGAFIITPDLINFAIDGITYKYTELEDGQEVEKSEVIDYLNYHDSYQGSPDVQPFYDTNGFTRTIIKFGTFSFSFSTYPVNKRLIREVLNLQGFLSSNETITNTVNKTFKFELKYTDGTNSYIKVVEMKLTNCTKNQNRGEALSLQLAFAQ